MRPSDIEMPGSIIAEIAFEIVRPVVQIAAYGIARVVVPIASLGCVRVEPLERSGRTEFVDPRWHGFNRTPNGSIVIEAEIASLIGLVLATTAMVGLGIHACRDSTSEQCMRAQHDCGQIAAEQPLTAR